MSSATREVSEQRINTESADRAAPAALCKDTKVWEMPPLAGAGN